LAAVSQLDCVLLIGFQRSWIISMGIISLDGVDTRRGEETALVDGFRALVTADENRRIRTRTMRGRTQRAREGRWVGGRPPFGLRAGADDHRLAVHDEELATIRRAVDLVIQHGLRATCDIASALNAEGRYPRQWSPSTKHDRELRWRTETIRVLLRSPHLNGVVTWGPEALEIPSPALIAE
jgi:site-specific DNA recombinase